MQPRELALKILYDIEKRSAYLNISFQNHAEQATLPPRDIAFVKELCYGVMQKKLRLDDAIAHFSSVRLKKLSPYVLSLLRIGLYQLFFMDKIPQSAAVNESVKLAGQYARQSKGFINAILRRAAREGLPELPSDETEALALQYSHPLPLVTWLQDCFGKEKARLILEENDQNPPLFLRVNTLKIGRPALLERLNGEGCTACEGLWSDSSILVTEGTPRQLSSYAEGLFTIQDQSAQLAALVLDPRPGQKVLDVCAAPGGKTTHLAELMQNRGSISALDIYEKRLISVTDAANRLGLSIIETQTADARQFTPPEPADKILVDAPCSGLGVIRRRPDLKYKADLTDFTGLTETQSAILHHSAGLLRHDGEMVYSTCTINPEENEKIIEAFLAKHKDFSLCPVKSEHITGKAAQLLKDGMATFYPDSEGGDGFFIAKLKKEKA